MSQRQVSMRARATRPNQNQSNQPAHTPGSGLRYSHSTRSRGTETQRESVRDLHLPSRHRQHTFFILASSSSVGGMPALSESCSGAAVVPDRPPSATARQLGTRRSLRKLVQHLSHGRYTIRVTATKGRHLHQPTGFDLRAWRGALASLGEPI